MTLLRWIEHLSGLGRVGRTAGQVEDKARMALQERIRHPALGGIPLHDIALPDDAIPVAAACVGYVQHVAVESLDECGSENGLQIGVLALAGSHVHPKTALAWIRGSGEVDEDLVANVRSAFTIGVQRSYDQDPRFGFSVLSEIASKALSPAVNDPGTAIDIINRGLRLLLLFCDQPENEPAEIRYPNLQVACISINDLFDDVFLPIARDGAGLLEVQLRLQKALLALQENNSHLFANEVQRCSNMALQYAEANLELEVERQRVRQVAEKIAAGYQQSHQV